MNRMALAASFLAVVAILPACGGGESTTGSGASTSSGGSGGTGGTGGSGPSCGDGKIDTGEECDDGKALSGDGCSSACKVEDGFTCSGTPSTCSSTCGDG